MTQEDKQLLLLDICGRLPYELYFKMEVDGMSTNKILTPEWISDIKYHPQYFKAYLRPMSSMTEEEFNELTTATELQYDQLELMDWGNDKTLEFYLSEVPQYCVIKVFDWLNAHHFDYRGLIPMGLAIEAPEGMYGKTSCDNCPDKDLCSQSEYVMINCCKLK